MYIDPTRYTTRPTDDRIPQELAIYDRLEQLSIPFIRVDHDHADTIEICHQVERILETEGLAGICGDRTVPSGLAMPRRQEIFACLNRC